MFGEKDKELLERFTKMSRAAGARADYVQGGGGNTSVKLENGLMAIKASGFCLSDIACDKAFAVLNYEALREFYHNNNPSDFADVETEGAAFTKKQIVKVEGMDELRPSVEAGFHSILKAFVLHTHSVYANLATCTNEAADILKKVFEGADYSYAFVPYTDPGANLTFVIRDAISKVESETGKIPSVILMENHGIIVHDDDEVTCQKIHSDANERIAREFNITADSFPEVSLSERDGKLVLENETLKKALKSGECGYSFWIETPLYPDQMVFLIGTLLDKATPDEGEAVIDGDLVVFNMDKSKAIVIAETMVAIAFITEHIKAKGYSLKTMGEKAKDFISNWESEKYRKSLSGKK